MKKIIILIPVFNDWESLEKLIVEINENIKELKTNSLTPIQSLSKRVSTWKKITGRKIRYHKIDIAKIIWNKLNVI